MKRRLLLTATSIILLLCPDVNFGQAPTLGTAANFVLFSTAGAVTNTGISHLTGNVGTNSGSSTGFGNVDGQSMTMMGCLGLAPLILALHTVS